MNTIEDSSARIAVKIDVRFKWLEVFRATIDPEEESETITLPQPLIYTKDERARALQSNVPIPI